MFIEALFKQKDHIKAHVQLTQDHNKERKFNNQKEEQNCIKE